MTETQEQTQESGNSASNLLLGVLAIVLVAGGIAALLWMNRGEGQVVRIDDPSPQPIAVASVTNAPVALAPLSPDAPRPTIRPGFAPSRPGSLLYPQSNGAFDLGDVHFLIIHLDQQWHGMDMNHNVRAAAGYPRRSDGTWELQAQWSVFSGTFGFRQTLKRIDPQTVAYDASVSSVAGVPTNALVLEAHLPVARYGGQQVIVDGKPVHLPLQAPPAGAQGLFWGTLVQRLQIATPDGQVVIDGPMQLGIQDNRQYGAKEYTARISFNPDKGSITQSSLQLTLRHLADRPASPASAPSAQPPVTTDGPRPVIP